jgi:MFS family permease
VKKYNLNWVTNLKHTEYFQTLSWPNFRRIWLANLVSFTGDILYDLAIVWFVAEEMQSALAVGSVIVASSLPILIFGLFGGAVADRVNRRKLMMVTDYLRAACVLLLPILFHFNILSLPLIILISFLRSVISQFFWPAQQAMIPSTVPENSLGSANSLNHTSSMIIAVAAPAIAGILIAGVGPVAAFYVDAGTFILSAMILFGIKIDVSSQTQSYRQVTPSVLLSDIVEGIKYIFYAPTLRVLAILSLIGIFGFGPYRPITVLYFQESVGMDSTQYGLTLSIAFLGMTLASAVAGAWIKKFNSTKIFTLGFVVMGITTIVIGLSPQISIIYAFSAFRAFGNGLIVIANVTLIQSQAKREQLGRVFSNMGVISEGARPVAIVAGTSLAELTSPQLAIVTSGLVFLIAAVMIVTRLREHPEIAFE